MHWNKPDILLKNERSISLLETGSFGRLAFVEVAARPCPHTISLRLCD